MIADFQRGIADFYDVLRDFQELLLENGPKLRKTQIPNHFVIGPGPCPGSIQDIVHFHLIPVYRPLTS